MDIKPSITPEPKYLTVSQLMEYIHFEKQTIYNYIYNGRYYTTKERPNQFVEGEHYVQPSPRKILFIKVSIDVWLNRGCKNIAKTSETEAPSSSINI